MESTIFRLVALHISLLLVASGAGGECSLSHARTRILSPTVVQGNTYAQMHNGSMFRMKLPTDLVKQSRSAVIANLDLYQQVNGCYALTTDAGAGNVGSY